MTYAQPETAGCPFRVVVGAWLVSVLCRSVSCESSNGVTHPSHGGGAQGELRVWGFKITDKKTKQNLSDRNEKAGIANAMYVPMTLCCIGLRGSGCILGRVVGGVIRAYSGDGLETSQTSQNARTATAMDGNGFCGFTDRNVLRDSYPFARAGVRTREFGESLVMMMLLSSQGTA